MVFPILFFLLHLVASVSWGEELHTSGKKQVQIDADLAKKILDLESKEDFSTLQGMYIQKVFSSLAQIEDGVQNLSPVMNIRGKVLMNCPDRSNYNNYCECLSMASINVAENLRSIDEDLYALEIGQLENAAASFETSVSRIDEAGAIAAHCISSCHYDMANFEKRLNTALSSSYVKKWPKHVKSKGKGQGLSSAGKGKSGGVKSAKSGVKGGSGIGTFKQFFDGAECKAAENENLYSSIHCSVVNIYSEMHSKIPEEFSKQAEFNAMAELLRASSAQQAINQFEHFFSTPLSCHKNEVTCSSIFQLVSETTTENEHPSWLDKEESIKKKVEAAKELLRLQQLSKKVLVRVNTLMSESKMCHMKLAQQVVPTSVRENCDKIFNEYREGEALLFAAERELKNMIQGHNDMVSDVVLNKEHLVKGDQSIIYGKFPIAESIAQTPDKMNGFDITSLKNRLQEGRNKVRMRTCQYLNSLCKKNNEDLMCNKTLLKNTLNALEEKSVKGEGISKNMSEDINQLSKCLLPYCERVKKDQNAWKEVGEASIMEICGALSLASFGVAGGVCAVVGSVIKGAVEIYEKDHQLEKMMECFVASKSCSLNDVEKARVAYEDTLKEVVLDTALNFADVEVLGFFKTLGKVSLSSSLRAEILTDLKKMKEKLSLIAKSEGEAKYLLQKEVKEQLEKMMAKIEGKSPKKVTSISEDIPTPHDAHVEKGVAKDRLATSAYSDLDPAYFEKGTALYPQAAPGVPTSTEKISTKYEALHGMELYKEIKKMPSDPEFDDLRRWFKSNLDIELYADGLKLKKGDVLVIPDGPNKGKKVVIQEIEEGFQTKVRVQVPNGDGVKDEWYNLSSMKTWQIAELETRSAEEMKNYLLVSKKRSDKIKANLQNTWSDFRAYADSKTPPPTVEGLIEKRGNYNMALSLWAKERGLTIKYESLNGKMVFKLEKDPSKKMARHKISKFTNDERFELNGKKLSIYVDPDNFGGASYRPDTHSLLVNTQMLQASEDFWAHELGHSLSRACHKKHSKPLCDKFPYSHPVGLMPELFQDGEALRWKSSVGKDVDFRADKIYKDYVAMDEMVQYGRSTAFENYHAIDILTNKISQEKEDILNTIYKKIKNGEALTPSEKNKLKDALGDYFAFQSSIEEAERFISFSERIYQESSDLFKRLEKIEENPLSVIRNIEKHPNGLVIEFLPLGSESKLGSKILFDPMGDFTEKTKILIDKIKTGTISFSSLSPEEQKELLKELVTKSLKGQMEHNFKVSSSVLEKQKKQHQKVMERVRALKEKLPEDYEKTLKKEIPQEELDRMNDLYAKKKVENVEEAKLFFIAQFPMPVQPPAKPSSPAAVTTAPLSPGGPLSPVPSIHSPVPGSGASKADVVLKFPERPEAPPFLGALNAGEIVGKSVPSGKTIVTSAQIGTSQSVIQTLKEKDSKLLHWLQNEGHTLKLNAENFSVAKGDKVRLSKFSSSVYEVLDIRTVDGVVEIMSESPFSKGKMEWNKITKPNELSFVSVSSRTSEDWYNSMRKLKDQNESLSKEIMEAKKRWSTENPPSSEAQKNLLDKFSLAVEGDGGKLFATKSYDGKNTPLFKLDKTVDLDAHFTHPLIHVSSNDQVKKKFGKNIAVMIDPAAKEPSVLSVKNGTLTVSVEEYNRLRSFSDAEVIKSLLKD